MKRHDYVLLQDQVFERVRELGRSKGRDYAGDADALANFKRHGQILGLSPLVIWAVYAGKHWDAVMAYIREPDRATSEPIQGRIDDLVTYLTLLTALIEERDKVRYFERAVAEETPDDAPNVG